MAKRVIGRGQNGSRPGLQIDVDLSGFPVTDDPERMEGSIRQQRPGAPRRLVIDLDPNVISQLRKRGIPCIYGDASNSEILCHASLDKARVLICTIPDYAAEELTARNALQINPKLDIVARVHRDSDVELLKNVGVSELVLPFFEGSLEMIRHTLHRFGLSSTEIQYILNNLRHGQVGEKKEDV